jgi:N-acyl-D-amino-acid deacylase
MFDVLLSGGLIADGSGSPLRRGNIAIKSGKITITNDEPEAAKKIDISGEIIAPGFVDIHTHSDLTLLSNPLAHSKIQQGVTTEVIGNCGYGVAPNPYSVSQNPLRSGLAFIDLDPKIDWSWKNQSDFLDTLASSGVSLNVASLIGHIPIHTAVAGFGEKIASPDEIKQMQNLLRENFASGAFGFSTGLNLTPVSYASESELVALAEVVAEFDGIFAIHMREYGDNLMRSIDEVIRIAKKSGARLQVSHLVALGEKNWGGVEKAFKVIEEANAQGCEINVDVYPYIAGSCPLSQILPDWAQEGGDKQMRERLKDIDVRVKVKKQWSEIGIDWENYQIASVFPEFSSFVAKRIPQIAKESEVEPDELALHLLSEMGHSIAIVAFGRNEIDVRTVFAHQLSMVGSDGLSLDPNGPTGLGVPHPRSYGTFPRVIKRYVGKDGISIERAIQICTGAPAKKLHLRDRGLIKDGYFADLVVFNQESIIDQATYEEPHQFPLGISYVFVNGQIVVDHGKHTGEKPGMILRHTR